MEFDWSRTFRKRPTQGAGIVTDKDRQTSSGFEEVGELFCSKRFSRRDLLKGAAAMGAAAAIGPVAAACGSSGSSSEATSSAPAAGTPNKGGDLMVGIVGGSAKDTADPHVGSYEPDIAIQYIMYEGLTKWDFDAQLQNQMAETVEPNADGSVWQFKLRDGMLWHDGKPVTADDVVFSMDRIVDPKDPKAGAALLSGVTVGGTKKIDDLTVEFNLSEPNVLLADGLAERTTKIVPVGFDPMNPIGSGPFKMVDMKPGEQFKWDAFADYWDTPPYVDTLTMIEFADDTARINALQGGQIQAMSQLPKSQVKVIEATDGLGALIAETGGWRPFTMRIDVKPFDDVRVRQAFRLIVDRQQMIDQAYSGLGALGNDMYGRFDPGTPDLPQRAQDIEQAKSLLKQAGYDNNLTVQLVTSEGALGGDEVAAAQVFAEQAKAAGVTVKIKKTDAGVFYGDDYLSWTFAQDFWGTRGYLAQTTQGTTPGAPYNETHWKNAEWLALVKKAFTTVDLDARNELISQAQQIEYDTGGYIIWSWRNQTDAYSKTTTGYKLDKYGGPIGRMYFKDVYFV
jgi:peptide/nickel transport system substrate-binding protein